MSKLKGLGESRENECGVDVMKMDRERIFRDEGEDCQCATKRAYGALSPHQF
jgi:hypothetical protein